MPSFRLSDGTNVVSMNPAWDIQFDDRKIESTHRTRSGAGYRYRWGFYDRCKFSVEFMSSGDMSQVNAWWLANTTLVLYDTTSTVILSGYLVNASAPVDKYIMPYTDYFKGAIELESF